MIPRLFSLLVLLTTTAGSLWLLAACERPLVDDQWAEVEVVSDLTQAFLSPDLELRVEVRSFRPVDSVAVNGRAMTFDPATRQWAQALHLQAGLNTLLIRTADAGGFVNVDTAYALYLPVSYVGRAPDLPEPRGGHTATLLVDGSVLVLGGAPAAHALAVATGFVLRPRAAGFAPLPGPMRAARTGHTASLLPDGRVLVLGGNRSGEVETLDDLVAEVEVFDPRDQAFHPVVYEGPPIRRAFHTAIVRSNNDGVFVDLYGGRGDIRYGDSPRLGIRRDLAIYEWRGDTLVARSPAPGHELDYGDALWGHTATPLASLAPGQIQRYLLAGSYFEGTDVDEGTFTLDYTTAHGIVSGPAGSLLNPRTRHAAALLRPGYVVVFGGYRASPSGALDAAEVYVAEARRFFRLPTPPGGLIKRFGLTATKTASERILLLGGFSPSGNGIAAAEVFEAASF